MYQFSAVICSYLINPQQHYIIRYHNRQPLDNTILFNRYIIAVLMCPVQLVKRNWLHMQHTGSNLFDLRLQLRSLSSNVLAQNQRKAKIISPFWLQFCWKYKRCNVVLKASKWSLLLKKKYSLFILKEN